MIPTFQIVIRTVLLAQLILACDSIQELEERDYRDRRQQEATLDEQSVDSSDADAEQSVDSSEAEEEELRDGSFPQELVVFGPTLVNHSSPIWQWTAFDMGIYQVALNDNKPLDWLETQYRPKSGLADGIHILSVRAQLRGGEWTDWSRWSIEIDTLPPELPTIEHTYDDETQVLEWRLTSAEQEVRMARTQTELEAMEFGPQKTFEVELETLEDGAYTVFGQAKDAAGNPSEIESNTVVIDRIPPEPPLLSGQLTTKNRRPEWNWVSVDGAGVFRYQLSDGSFSEPDTATSYSPSFDLADGEITLKVQERDAAGNWSETSSFTSTIDTEKPSSPTVTSVESPTTETKPVWTWLADEAIETKIILAPASSDPEIDFTEVLPWEGGAQFMPEDELEDGSYTLYVTTSDEAGNWSDPGSFSVTIDTTPPSAPTIEGAVRSNLESNEITWVSTASDGSGVFGYTIDEGDEVETEVTSLSFAFPESGNVTVGVREKDFAGNWSEASYHTLSVQIFEPLQDFQQARFVFYGEPKSALLAIDFPDCENMCDTISQLYLFSGDGDPILQKQVSNADRVGPENRPQVTLDNLNLLDVDAIILVQEDAQGKRTQQQIPVEFELGPNVQFDSKSVHSLSQQVTMPGMLGRSFGTRFEATSGVQSSADPELIFATDRGLQYATVNSEFSTDSTLDCILTNLMGDVIGNGGTFDTWLEHRTFACYTYDATNDLYHRTILTTD